MGVGSLLTFESPALDEPKTEGGQHLIPDYPGSWRFAPASDASDPSATGNLPLTCLTIPRSRQGSTANRLEIALETPFLGPCCIKVTNFGSSSALLGSRMLDCVSGRAAPGEAIRIGVGMGGLD